jgi:pyridoxine kinase
MSVALIVSSFVAASRIGGAAQQFVLAAQGIDPVLAPTVMYGRSPARGSQGEITEPAVLRRMLGDIEADALFGMVDLVITGHFSSAAQVEIVADLLGRIRASRDLKQPVLLVDPIMGDAPKGLYVDEGAAEAVAERLVPLADWITPNLWELGRLTGSNPLDAAAVVAAARSLGRPALVTSAPAREGEAGLILVEADNAVLFAHPRLAASPSGTGDLVTASFAAGLVQGLTPAAAAERAAGAAYLAVAAAQAWGGPELPVVALGDQLTHPDVRIRIEPLEPL